MKSRLIRLHLPDEVVVRLDELTGALSGANGKKPSRAAVTRALLLWAMESDAKLEAILREDPIRRGRPREPQLPLFHWPGPG